MIKATTIHKLNNHQEFDELDYPVEKIDPPIIGKVNAENKQIIKLYNQRQNKYISYTADKKDVDEFVSQSNENKKKYLFKSGLLSLIGTVCGGLLGRTKNEAFVLIGGFIGFAAAAFTSRLVFGTSSRKRAKEIESNLINKTGKE